MKRLHIHVNVEDLDKSIRFYDSLYGQPPTVVKSDYAKWVLADPHVNFAISKRSEPGAEVSHLGIEVDNSGDLEDYNTRLQIAGQSGDQTGENSGAITVRPEKNAHCCYAISDKYWATDPGGVAWEFFHTRGTSEGLGDEGKPAQWR